MRANIWFKNWKCLIENWELNISYALKKDTWDCGYNTDHTVTQDLGSRQASPLSQVNCLLEGQLNCRLTASQLVLNEERNPGQTWCPRSEGHGFPALGVLAELWGRCEGRWQGGHTAQHPGSPCSKPQGCGSSTTSVPSCLHPNRGRQVRLCGGWAPCLLICLLPSLHPQDLEQVSPPPSLWCLTCLY